MPQLSQGASLDLLARRRRIRIYAVIGTVAFFAAIFYVMAFVGVR